MGKRPSVAAPRPSPEDRLFVEQRVEHALRTEALEQALGDAVDAALFGDVFAEDERLGVAVQNVVECTVDPERHGHRGVRIAGPDRCGERRGSGGDRFFESKCKRLHHRPRAIELLGLGNFARKLEDF